MPELSLSDIEQIARDIRRQKIIRALADYKNYISVLNDDEELQKYLRLLEPSIYLPDKNPEGTVISLMSGMHSLELLKNNLLTVESFMLRTISKH